VRRHGELLSRRGLRVAAGQIGAKYVHLGSWFIRSHDLILDIRGKRSLSHLRRALTATGTLVSVEGEEGGKWLGGVDRSLRAVVLSAFVRQTLRAQFPAEREVDLRVQRSLIEDGKITPVIDKPFPLSEAADAVRYIEAGRGRGKTLLTV
jgi:NADPH:quinone reductase-like Zn-dependent oxidoreductase